MANDISTVIFPSSKMEVDFFSKKFTIKDETIPEEDFNETNILPEVIKKDVYSRLNNCCRQFKLTITTKRRRSYSISFENSTFNCGGLHFSMITSNLASLNEIDTKILNNILDNLMSMSGNSSIYGCVFNYADNYQGRWGMNGIGVQRYIDGKFTGVLADVGFKVMGTSCSGKHSAGSDLEMLHIIRIMPFNKIACRQTTADFSVDRNSWKKETSDKNILKEETFIDEDDYDEDEE